MSMFSMLEISGSALSAERQRAEVVAANMANSNTTHTGQGRPLPSPGSDFLQREDVSLPAGAEPVVFAAGGRNAER